MCKHCEPINMCKHCEPINMCKHCSIQTCSVSFHINFYQPKKLILFLVIQIYYKVFRK